MRPDDVHPPCESSHPHSPESCPLCQLAETSEKYQNAWRVTPVVLKKRPLPSKWRLLKVGEKNRAPGSPSRPVPRQPLFAPAFSRGPLPCVHRGDELSISERKRYSLPLNKNWVECDHPEKPLGPHVCSCGGCGPSCRGYSNTAPSLDTDCATVGVALGCYGMPKLAELQIRQIRSTCGMIPILLCDDGSESVYEFEEIAKRYEGVDAWPNTSRLGHYAGDLSVFSKAVKWAAKKDLDVVIKLSQRFLWTKSRWANEAANQLVSSPQQVMMQKCLDNKVQLYVRSECMAMRVKSWVPLLPEMRRDKLGNPTELHVWHLVHTAFGGDYLTWKDLTVDRYRASPQSLWHCHSKKSEYESLAAQHGLTLDESFFVEGQTTRKDWKKG